jgi:hypothetical protein
VFGAALIFFIFGLLAIFFATSGVDILSLDIARTLFVTFFALAVISFLAGVIGGKSPPVSPQNEEGV